MTQPSFYTDRLLLRPFALTDAADVQKLAGAREIADTTLRIPHPYEDGMAEQWISCHEEQFEAGTKVVFAIELAATDGLAGAVGLEIDRPFAKATLGYWIGKPFWNQGYATEAAKAIVDYAFRDLGLNRIASSHLTRNPASGRVMQKIGMAHEGTLRQDTIKWDVYEDLHVYGLLKEDWERSTTRGQ